MDNVLAIARTTFGKFAGNKTLYLLWVLLLVLIAATSMYNVLTIGRAKVLMIDLGLALIALVGACSVLIISYDIPRELRQRIAENMLSKPVGRDQYLIGKFLGSLSFALTNVLILTVGFLAIVQVAQQRFPVEVIPPLVGILGMMVVLAAAAALFGTFLSEVPAVLATFLVFWLGHSTQAILKLTAAADGSLTAVGKALYGLLPNLNLLNMRAESSQAMFAKAQPIAWDYVGMSAGYALLYAVALMSVAMMVFRRRDL
jgi:ABC-type transport system involved in multi-copper enzyme maturation permease subunit